MLRKLSLKRQVMHSILHRLRLKRLALLSTLRHLHTQHHMVQLEKDRLAMNSTRQILLL